MAKKINLRKASKKAVPVLSVPYLLKQVRNESSRHFDNYHANSTRATLRRDLLNLTTELIGAAKDRKVKTNSLSRIRNELINKKHDLKSERVYKNLVKRIDKTAKQISTYSEAKASGLFTEGVFTTKTGKARKKRKGSSTFTDTTYAPPQVTKNMKLFGQQQLRQVISNILKTEGLVEEILNPRPAVGELEYLPPYMVSRIAQMNDYVPHVDLFDEMFIAYEYDPSSGAMFNLVASGLTMEIARLIQSGGQVNPKGSGSLILPEPYMRYKSHRTTKKAKK